MTSTEPGPAGLRPTKQRLAVVEACLLYTSDAADE